MSISEQMIWVNIMHSLSPTRWMLCCEGSLEFVLLLHRMIIGCFSNCSSFYLPARRFFMNEFRSNVWHRAQQQLMNRIWRCKSRGATVTNSYQTGERGKKTQRHSRHDSSPICCCLSPPRTYESPMIMPWDPVADTFGRGGSQHHVLENFLCIYWFAKRQKKRAVTIPSFNRFNRRDEKFDYYLSVIVNYQKSRWSTLNFHLYLYRWSHRH